MPPQILQSLLTFINLQPGVTQTLPHGLAEEGAAVVPDFLTPLTNSAAINFASNNLNVTATLAIGQPITTCQVLVTYEHSFNRSFPGAANRLQASMIVLPGPSFDPGGLVSFSGAFTGTNPPVIQGTVRGWAAVTYIGVGQYRITVPNVPPVVAPVSAGGNVAIYCTWGYVDPTHFDIFVWNFAGAPVDPVTSISFAGFGG